MKRKALTRASLLSLFLLLTSISYSQNGVDYRIENAADYDLSLLEKTLNKADLDAYRRLETDRTLLFDNGAEVTLFPAKHLEESGLEVNTSVAIPEDYEIDPNRVFILHPSGMLMEAITPPQEVKR